MQYYNDDFSPQALNEKFVFFFINIIECQSVYYNSVKFQVDQLENKKVTIYPSALLYKQEGVRLRHIDFISLDHRSLKSLKSQNLRSAILLSKLCSIV